MAKARREEADGHTHGVMTEWEEQDEKNSSAEQSEKKFSKTLQSPKYSTLNTQNKIYM